MVEHHFMILPAEAGFFITAEGGVCRIGMVAVDPYAAGLDRSWNLVEFVCVPCPYSGAKAVERIVGDLYGFFGAAEGGDTTYGAEDLFLEDTHFIVAFEEGGLDIVAMFESAVLVEG